MKLTRGKIAKLYNKKKQTLKNFKKNKESLKKTRTIRSHYTNLANKTLKKWM